MADALRWYERALAHGYLMAGKSLIVSAATATMPDYVQAEKWILVLAARGNELPAPMKRDLDGAEREVEAHLSADQLRAARDQAQDWIRQHGLAPPWRPKRGQVRDSSAVIGADSMAYRAHNQKLRSQIPAACSSATSA